MLRQNRLRSPQREKVAYKMRQSIEIAMLDPALAECIREGESDDEIPVIARLAESAGLSPIELPQGIRIVTRFGDIATLRLKTHQINELMQSDAVFDLEASRMFRAVNFESHAVAKNTVGKKLNTEQILTKNSITGQQDSYQQSDGIYSRRPAGLTTTGKGSVIGVLDWGIDFTFPAFRHEDGSTRLEAIWDQRGHDDTSHENRPYPNRWGYGRIYNADDINHALLTDKPFDELDYDPSDSDTQHRKNGEWQGAHGTHVTHIAAGNERGDGMSGVAPDADLVFVHLSRTAKVLGSENLGDSASVLEAIDFVFSVAGDRPCVINMSVGAHGGPHNGMTLLEQGVDRAVWLNNGRVLVNSAGNYFESRVHARGKLATDEEDILQFDVPKDDPTRSELEVFYEKSDRFKATVLGPEGQSLGSTLPGENAPLILDGKRVGFMYHRNRQIGSGDRHIDIFLHPQAPAGLWELKLHALFAEDGRFHAWIERDRGLSPRFVGRDVDTSFTTGTICNGKYSITVGAYNPHQQDRPMGAFSSAGPTRDGRMKPEIIAPGVGIVSARSTPPDALPGARYTSKNGTSMAAPHVAGTVALMFEAAYMPMNIVDIRALLFSSATPVSSYKGISPVLDIHRSGYGYLDSLAAEKAASEWAKTQTFMESMGLDDTDQSRISKSRSANGETDVIAMDNLFDYESDPDPDPQLSDVANIQAENLPVNHNQECRVMIDNDIMDESLLRAISVLLPADGSKQLMNFALTLLGEDDSANMQENLALHVSGVELNLIGSSHAEAPYEDT